MKTENMRLVMNGVGWATNTTKSAITAYSLCHYTKLSAVTNRKYLQHAARVGLLRERVTYHRPGIIKRTYVLTFAGWDYLRHNKLALI